MKTNITVPNYKQGFSQMLKSTHLDCQSTFKVFLRRWVRELVG